MKLLLDENLSFRICPHLAEHFDDVRHVRDYDLLETDDRKIWDFAKENGFAIVTQDQDFVGRVVVDGAPPKVIWIRLSDAKVRQYIDLLLDHVETISQFFRDSNTAYIEISPVQLI